MSLMLIEAINLEEELVNMKATLDSKEKDAQIKYQNKQIVDLGKKLEKQLSKASNKGSGGEDFDKESNHRKKSDVDRKPNNNSTLNSMSVKQILPGSVSLQEFTRMIEAVN